MTRTPLRRFTPLRPGNPPRRTSRLNPLSSRTRAKRRAWANVVRQALALCGGRCVFGIPNVCEGRAVHGHHVRPRSQGGADTLDNVAAVCAACHSWAHLHPELAYERGMLVRRNSTGDSNA